MPNNLETALAYAAMGWHVLPVIKNAKTPACKNGVHDATVDTVQIKSWWAKNPEYNIGIATGKRSGIIVFDVDPRNGGADTWRDFLDDNGKECLADAPMQITGGRGEHWVAEYNEHVKSSKMLEGVDLLSDGRYFIAYPSIVDGNSYDWEADSDPLDGEVKPFVIPAQWGQVITSKRNDTNDTIKSGNDVITGSRNVSLTAFGGAIRNLGASESEILAALIEANNMRCVPPLPSSEVRQIARSVARYEPNSNVLVDMSVGDQAALAFLGETQNKIPAGGFHFSSAKFLIEQPAPVPFIVSKWIPAGGVGTLFGQPGIGKSFLSVDLACSIVSGQEWLGRKIKQRGPVLYMAGEGNFGIRQRVAAWCQMNECIDIEDLYVSNRALDLDAPGAHLEVIQAAMEVGAADAKLIIIDTLNRHMFGDENKATDIRKLLDACSLVSAATGAAVLLVHHSGHGEGAGARERGSSALRGAMDFAVYMSRNKDKSLNIHCAKMKDALEPDDVIGDIKSAKLGWVDEDGEVTNGAYFVYQQAKTEKKKSDAETREKTPEDFKNNDEHIAQFYKYFYNAWVKSGCETLAEMPYVSKAALRNYLYDLMAQGHDYFSTESKIKQCLKPSDKARFVGKLIEENILKTNELGYSVSKYPHVCDEWAARHRIFGYS